MYVCNSIKRIPDVNISNNPIYIKIRSVSSDYGRLAKKCIERFSNATIVCQSLVREYLVYPRAAEKCLNCYKSVLCSPASEPVTAVALVAGGVVIASFLN